MIIRTSLLFLILCFFTQLLAAQALHFAVAEIEESLFKNANAIVRLDNTTVDQSDKKKLTVSKHVAITALNKRGSHFLNFRESYKEGSDKIKNIEIKYYDKNGKLIREIGKKDIQDLSAYDGFSMITDSRIKYFEYETSVYPITIEYVFKFESKNTLLIPPWIPIGAFGLAVEKSSYTNDGPLNHHYEQNFKNLNITKKLGKYSCYNVQAFPKENLSPSLSEIVPHVLFSPREFQYEGYVGQFDNWTELGKWTYDNFLEDRNDLIVSDVKDELDEIIGHEKNPERIARIIYDYVQETTRYINIALDEGGIRPMKSNEVHAKKYGDCKALSFYTKALLNIYNVEANYVEIYADSENQNSFYTEFCSATQGNHIILNIPLGQDTAWIDCTSGQLPFNFLGEFTDDRRALMISENGGQLVRTPKYTASENATRFMSDLVLDENGNTTISTEISSRGLQMSERLFLFDIKEEDWEDRIKSSMFSSLNNLNIKKKEKQLIEENFEFIEKYSLESTTYGSIAGKYMVLPLTFSKFEVPKLKNAKDRKYNIHLKRGYSKYSIQNIKIPSGYTYADKTLDKSINSEYGKYELKMNIAEDEIQIERNLIINDGNYSSDKYGDIRSFFNSVLKIENSQISIKQLQ